MLGQLQPQVIPNHRNLVQKPAACGPCSMKGQQQQQMRGTGFASTSQQLKQHAYMPAVPSLHNRRRHQVVLAAIGNGNGQPAAAEGEERGQILLLRIHPCMSDRCQLWPPVSYTTCGLVATTGLACF